MSQVTAIPTPALVLGWLGVLPFAASSLAALLGSPDTARIATQALVVYATIILSFMGGVQWGVAMVAADKHPTLLLRRLCTSTLPALAAFATVALPGRASIFALAIAFIALLAYDLTTAAAGVSPRWYPALRLQLTAAVVFFLLVSAQFGRA